MDADRFRRILHLAGPIVGGMISQNLLNLIDTAMVGSLGKEALAGVGVASFAYFMSFAAITGLSSAVQAVASRRIGQERTGEAAVAVHEGLLVALTIGLPLAAMLWFAAPALFHLLQDDAAVQGHAIPYYRARLAALAAVGVNFAFRGFWNGVDRPTLYFQTLVVMHVVNVVLSYGLIFGELGMPELGSMGAGVGSAIATWIGTAMYIVLGFRHGRMFGFLQRSAAPTLASMAGLLRLAVPSSMQSFLFAAGFNVLFWIIGRMGTDEVAAANVLVNLTLVAILPGMGLGIAAATLVGQSLGRGDAEDATRWGWQVSGVAVVTLVLIGLPMWLIPDPILGIFLPNDPGVVDIARWPLRLVGLTIALDGVGMVLLNALLGAGAARTVMLLATSLQWGFFLPAAYLIGPVFGYGLFAVWCAQVVQRGVQAGAFAWVWRKGAWASIKV